MDRANVEPRLIEGKAIPKIAREPRKTASNVDIVKNLPRNWSESRKPNKTCWKRHGNWKGQVVLVKSEYNIEMGANF